MFSRSILKYNNAIQNGCKRMIGYNTMQVGASASSTLVRSFSTASTTTTTATKAEQDAYQARVIAPSPQRGRRPNKQRPTKFPQYSNIPRINTEGFHRLANMGFDFYFLDVRDEASYKESHIQGSTNHPIATLEKTSEELHKNVMTFVFGPKDKGFPVGCEAATILNAKGFKSVVVLESSVQELADIGFFYNSEKDLMKGNIKGKPKKRSGDLSKATPLHNIGPLFVVCLSSSALSS
ncbi:hypothetical protein DFA_05634 [Cavenderia fasciculata]|uniref:Rhodanese domain-containing protein n=1 Tax=Cavenderia fasciculata TaxID=261658 RepID=F4PLU7_CACFS|nr:uncharacterized protein DFA_05634 [Cavenderia fasciculata]EGG23501.1 hypothetical protein DFA_05634 [Cavenderia fasciculata]|eukprot:XP_004361352.1 hypothetical protein DFA_05634 [Cavenderia fasciculata]